MHYPFPGLWALGFIALSLEEPAVCMAWDTLPLFYDINVYNSLFNNLLERCFVELFVINGSSSFEGRFHTWT